MRRLEEKEERDEEKKKKRALELLKYRQLKRGTSILASRELSASLKNTIHNMSGNR